MTSDSEPTLSEEEMRKLLKPNPSEEETIKALKDGYFKPGSNVTIVKKLDSYDDVNFLVKVVQETDGSSELFLAKVHNGVESADLVRLMEKNDGDYYKCNNESIIHYQNSLMEHLNSHDISTSKPHACVSDSNPAPASIHSLPVVSAEHSPQKLVVRLLSWLPGRTMESVKALPIESLAQAGQFLGSLDAKLDLLDANAFPSSKRYHVWDGKNTADVRQFVKYVTNDKRREMVVSVIDAFEKELIEGQVGSSFRKGIIQGDFNDANIIMDNDLRVSGVIDFGDSVERYVRSKKRDSLLLHRRGMAHQTRVPRIQCWKFEVDRLTKIVVGGFCFHLRTRTRNFISTSNIEPGN